MNLIDSYTLIYICVEHYDLTCSLSECIREAVTSICGRTVNELMRGGHTMSSAQQVWLNSVEQLTHMCVHLRHVIMQQGCERDFCVELVDLATAAFLTEASVFASSACALPTAERSTG